MDSDTHQSVVAEPFISLEELNFNTALESDNNLLNNTARCLFNEEKHCRMSVLYLVNNGKRQLQRTPNSGKSP